MRWIVPQRDLPNGSRFAGLLLGGAIVALAATAALAGSGSAPSEEGIVFFENKIRPLLHTHCVECHGEQRAESGLRLDTYPSIIAGGNSGAPVVAGAPDQSLLILAVQYLDPDLQMPPTGQLSPAQILDLRRWVEMGAPHPDASGAAPLPRRGWKLEEAKDFWAFQPLRPPAAAEALPKTVAGESLAGPIDAFIRSQQQLEHIAPVHGVDRRTFIRRATLDLHGIPPTPAEVEDYLADESPLAKVRLLDRLLASPRYGERWGRFWLDVVRYADSNGLDENIAHGNAWRYRDYVISALNEDLPFDDFVIEQLAGDLLVEPVPESVPERLTAAHQLRHRRLIATGFLSLGPKVLAEVDEQKMEMDIVDEQVSTVGTALMGLTIGCARCHDHKFDPISTRDYYALAGIFKSTLTMDSFTKIAKWHEHEIPTSSELLAQQQHTEKLAALDGEIQKGVERAKQEVLSSLAPGEPMPEDWESRAGEPTRMLLLQLRQQRSEIEKQAPQRSSAMGVIEGKVADSAVHLRGSHLTLGESVPRGFPEVLQQGTAVAIGADQSGRLQLAHWLVDSASPHPLTSRVLVNRIWSWHFGRGIVESVDNFGLLGAAPSHPQLLDYLARRLIESGWSIKSLHREMMLSEVYQLSSTIDPNLAERDPENRWYWRASPRRLEAEAIRDSLLAVGGLLDHSMGGSMLHVGNREFLFDHTSKDETKYESPRRSIYLPVIRNHLYDVFQLFDYADASVSSGLRSQSTVATQSLFFLNGPLVLAVADSIASDVLQDADFETRIETLYQRVLGRSPEPQELLRVEGFLGELRASMTAEGKADETIEHAIWAALCQTLLATSQWMHIP